MSTVNTRVNTANQMTTDYDLSKIFLGNNRYENDSYTNGGGSPVTLLTGTLMGRISTTGLLIPLASAAADGSQFPVGVLASDYTVAAGATQVVSVCIAGDVRSDKIILAGSDTLETQISSRRIKDRIQGDTVGIKLVTTIEMTYTDN